MPPLLLAAVLSLTAALGAEAPPPEQAPRPDDAETAEGVAHEQPADEDAPADADDPPTPTPTTTTILPSEADEDEVTVRDAPPPAGEPTEPTVPTNPPPEATAGAGQEVPATATPPATTTTPAETAPPTAPTTTTTTTKPKAKLKSTTPPAAPAEPSEGQRRGKRVRRSIANTQWPVEPAFNVGFLLSEPGILPYANVSLYVPILPGLGPVVAGTILGTNTPDSTFVSGFVGLGVGLEGKLGTMRARISAIPSLVVDHLSSNTVNETLLNPSMLVPLEVGLPLFDGVSFTGSATLGVASAVGVFSGNTLETGRDRFFLMVGAGLNFGGPVD